MIEQNMRAIGTEERTYIAHKLLQARFLEFIEEPRRALEIYAQAAEQSEKVVDGCRDQLRQELALQEERKRTNQKALGSDAYHRKAETTPEEGEEGDDEDKTGRVAWCRNQIREALEIQHTATFSMASVYYQIKTNETLTEPESEDFALLERKETELYDQAKLIRKEVGLLNSLWLVVSTT
jgi:E3 ubiquitin-protein ligase SHPRH